MVEKGERNQRRYGDANRGIQRQRSGKDGTVARTLGHPQQAAQINTLSIGHVYAELL